MRRLMLLMLGMSLLAPAVSFAADNKEAAKDAAEGEQALVVKLEKEPEMKKEAEVAFIPAAKREGARAAYKGYKHSGMEGYEKVAARKKILNEGWEAECSKKEECSKALEGKPAEAAQRAEGKGAMQGSAKDSVKKLAQKMAFTGAAKKAIEGKMAEAKAKGDVKSESKLGEAKKMIEADNRKYAGEAKKMNERLKVKVFEPEAEEQIDSAPRQP